MKEKYAFLLAVLTYLPTLVLVPQAIIYILISLIGFVLFLKDAKRNKINRNDFYIVLFVLASFVIYVVGKPYAIDETSKSLNDFIPYTFFILTTIYFSKHLNIKVLKWILLFIILECIIGIIQYMIGVPFFFAPKAVGMQGFGESEYLYYNKVYGLSAVTSVFALKVFSGFLLLYFINDYKFSKYIYIILIGGLLVTFNRTAIVSSMVFSALVFFENLKSRNIKIKILTILSLTIIIGLIWVNINKIQYQFFRGNEVDLSGRDMVFPYYINFIQENIFFGNFFTKHWVALSIDRVYHAHNSFLQTFANMGLIFGGGLVLILFRRINRLNLIYIFPIIIYSLFQYGVFWGVSYLDIIFFYFLYNVFREKNKVQYAYQC